MQASLVGVSLRESSEVQVGHYEKKAVESSQFAVGALQSVLCSDSDCLDIERQEQGGKYGRHQYATES